MTTSLRSQLNDLASSFADGVLAAIRAASLEELTAESGARGGRAPRGGGGGQPDPLRKGGRLARRSQEQIDAALGKVVALVKSKKDGLRSEEIRAALKLDRREVPRVLKEGLRTKKLRAKGQKRATVYRAA